MIIFKKIFFCLCIAMTTGLNCHAKGYTLNNDEMTLLRYIAEGMPKTVREMKEDKPDMLAVPHPYSVPTIRGRFQEMYYWDTYFTNVGLIALGDVQQAKNNIDNILFLVEKMGYMPNGTYKSLWNRTQPPYSAMMAREVYEKTGDKKWLAKSYASLELEYQFWMTKRITSVGLNRYGHCATEKELVNFYKQIAKRMNADRSSSVITRADTIKASAHWMAEAESGWDFNPRFAQRCMDFCPVDLNALLYVFEKNMAFFSSELGNGKKADWEKKAEVRKALIQKYCYNQGDGLFDDYDVVYNCQSKVLSGAVFNLMYAGVMTKKQAKTMAKALSRLEMEWGVAACEEVKSDITYQWAYPNAWAAVNYMAIAGLDHYGLKKDANRLARKYLDSNVGQYKETGVLWEKYNAKTGRNDAAAEYATPGHFMGWTAGTVVFCMKYLTAKDLIY